MTDTHRIGDAVVTVGPSWVVTRFEDGQVHAHPEYDHVSFARSRDLGYADVGAMTRDHDVLHSLLADARGLPSSPTLLGVARGASAPAAVMDDEERIVLLIQRLLNVGVAGVLADYEKLA